MKNKKSEKQDKLRGGGGGLAVVPTAYYARPPWASCNCHLPITLTSCVTPTHASLTHFCSSTLGSRLVQCKFCSQISGLSFVPNCLLPIKQKVVSWWCCAFSRSVLVSWSMPVLFSSILTASTARKPSLWRHAAPTASQVGRKLTGRVATPRVDIGRCSRSLIQDGC